MAMAGTSLGWWLKGEPVESIKGVDVFVQSATLATEQLQAFDQVFWSTLNL